MANDRERKQNAVEFKIKVNTEDEFAWLSEVFQDRLSDLDDRKDIEDEDDAKESAYLQTHLDALRVQWEGSHS